MFVSVHLFEVVKAYLELEVQSLHFLVKLLTDDVIMQHDFRSSPVNSVEDLFQILVHGIKVLEDGVKLVARVLEQI